MTIFQSVLPVLSRARTRSLPQPMCQLCNRFMSWHDVHHHAVSWTRFSGPLEDEPREPEYAHVGCWHDAEPLVRATIRYIGWVAPFYRGRAA